MKISEIKLGEVYGVAESTWQHPVLAKVIGVGVESQDWNGRPTGRKDGVVIEYIENGIRQNEVKGRQRVVRSRWVRAGIYGILEERARKRELERAAAMKERVASQLTKMLRAAGVDARTDYRDNVEILTVEAMQALAALLARE